MRITSTIAIIMLGTISTAVNATDISGAGATFPYPIYSKWADAYKKETGISINYQSIGSGGGIKQVKAKTVTFGATDAPLNKNELDENNLFQFPAIIGGIVPVVNAVNIKAIDGTTLSKVFLGQVKPKDSPYNLIPVYRSDGSGTTYNFTYYLATQDVTWKDSVGVSTAVKWPIGVGAKGNEGVASTVAKMQKSIGYVEYAYIKQNKLAYLTVMNKEGKFAEPSLKSFASAAKNGSWSADNGFNTNLIDQSGIDSWPITTASWILVNKNDPKSKDVIKFFMWAFEFGGSMAENLDYVPVNTDLQQKIKLAWQKVNN